MPAPKFQELTVAAKRAYERALMLSLGDAIQAARDLNNTVLMRELLALQREALQRSAARF
jgi:hypothetical protein